MTRHVPELMPSGQMKRKASLASNEPSPAFKRKKGDTSALKAMKPAAVSGADAKERKDDDDEPYTPWEEEDDKGIRRLTILLPAY